MVEGSPLEREGLDSTLTPGPVSSQRTATATWPAKEDSKEWTDILELNTYTKEVFWEDEVSFLANF
jgi:hypothetical protein